MSESQEDILANFQSITAIDDVAEAILHLEESAWDLLTAVHRVLPQEHDVLPMYTQSNSEPLNNLNVVHANNENALEASSSPIPLQRNIFGSEQSTSADLPIDLNGIVNIEMNDSTSQSGIPSISAKPPKDVVFNIHHNYETHKFVISDHATIGDLRNKIAEYTSISNCRQSLRGWIQPNEAYTNNTKLNTMSIARENELIVTDIAEEGGVTINDNTVDRLSTMFTLNVLNEIDSIALPLKFRGTETILDIKRDVYTITNIAVRYQEWTGWPVGTTDDTILALSNIPLELNLTLRSTEGTTSSQLTVDENRPVRNHASAETIDIDSDSSIDEFEDASDFNAEDEIFSATAHKRIKHLIPDGTDDERTGSIEFVKNYIERYGEPHPTFFEGILEEALNVACHKPAKERKLLAIYLHHDGSVLTNVFCDRLLKYDSIMQTFEHNFVIYGWDLTFESNKNLFLSSLSACAGTTALITVRNMAVNRLPAVLVIGKSRSVCEVLSVIYGNVGVDELLNKLMDTINMYSDQRDIEIREEDERAAREQVKMEQDAAYRESLEADKRKEEAKQQKERAMATERKRLESERQEIEAIREINRLEAGKCVPPEPDADVQGITKIRIRKPTGEFLERRFTADTKLDILIKFVASNGFPIDEFKIISSWPRRDLTTLNVNETLLNLKLCPQETVILEER